MVAFLFFIFATMLVASAILMVAHKNPVYNAVFLIVAFFSIAGLYFLLGAQFLSVVQIIVYAGAIMVLFLFVIMLLNLGSEARLPIGKPYQIFFGGIFALILVIQLLLILSIGLGKFASLSETPRFGSVESLGLALFSKYVYPFEVASVLLLVGIVGAIILGRKKLPKEE